MKRLMFVFAPAALALATLSGCASKQPPAELRDARAAYSRAQAGPAAQANPAGLFEAKRALDQAERRFADDPGSDDVKNLAYVAQRKSEMAEAGGRQAIARAQQVQAEQALSQMQRQQFADAQKQLMQEREFRMQAERRAKEAFDKLGSFDIKEGPRGMTVTLSGSVLFASGKADLLPSSKKRLDDVAEALKEVKDRKIVIVGHTDSTGSTELNERLSKERAEAVKSYLASHGVSGDMITAEGKGEADPIATNATPEGRANNRRVEIIIERAPGEQGTGMTGRTPSTTSPSTDSSSMGTQGSKTVVPNKQDQTTTPNNATKQAPMNNNTKQQAPTQNKR